MISHQSLSTLGGVPLHIHQLAEALVDLGVRVDVVAPAPQMGEQGISCRFPLTTIRLSSPLATGRAVEFCYKVHRRITERKRRPDAIHASQWSGYIIGRHAYGAGIPVVTKFHGTMFYGALARIRSRELRCPAIFAEAGGALFYLHAERTVARNSQGLIFISASVRREVESMTLGRIAGNSCIIYNGVDTAKFRPLDTTNLRERYGLTEEDRIVLYVGRLTPTKGVSRLILSSARLMSKYKNLKVVITGTGKHSYVTRLLTAARPRRNFIFTGWVDHDKLPEIYGLADIVVAPSVYAAGNVVLEAMACAKPVIAPPGSGFAELVRPFETGLIPDSTDIESCLAFALENNESLRRMGKNARAFAERNLSWSKTALETIEFVRAVAE